MKKQNFCCCLGAGLVIVFTYLVIFSYADETSYWGQKQRAMDEAMHRIEIGTEVSFIQYKEPGLMRERGMMYGITGSYTYHGLIPGVHTPIDPLEDWVLTLEGRGSWGGVDYRNSGAINNIKDFIFESRGLAGYDFSSREDIAFIPYMGLGFRYLQDDGGGKVSSTGANFYKRESKYLYIPLGIESKVRSKNDWVLGVRIEYDFLAWAEQKTYLSDVNPGYNDPVNRQRKGYGMRGSVKFIKALDKLDLVIEPFYRYWSVASSERANWTYYGTLIGYTWEPKNTSREAGIKLSTVF